MNIYCWLFRKLYIRTVDSNNFISFFHWNDSTSATNFRNKLVPNSCSDCTLSIVRITIAKAHTYLVLFGNRKGIKAHTYAHTDTHIRTHTRKENREPLMFQRITCAQAIRMNFPYVNVCVYCVCMDTTSILLSGTLYRLPY